MKRNLDLDDVPKFDSSLYKRLNDGYLKVVLYNGRIIYLRS